MSELDDLERDLLVAADIWFNQDLHKKLQRLIAIAREGERWREFATAVSLSQKMARDMPLNPPGPPPSFLRPGDPVDQPAVPRTSPGGGAAATVSSKQFAEPADMHGNGA